MWRSGETVTLRFGSIDGRFHSGRPVRVIEHTPELLVTFMAEGTTVSVPMLADGRGLRDVPLEERWSHPRTSLRRPWLGTELIQLFPRGRAHSIWVVRDKEHAMVGWYVNLEDVHELGASTITTRDHVLDIWVPAATGEPEWKDEDELAAATRVGRLSAEQAAEIRAEGERVWRERPWPTGWEDWNPPAHWKTPTLPDGWDRELRTARLQLLPLGKAHAAGFAVLVGADGARRETRAAEEHWKRHGFGPWAVFEEGAFAGIAEVQYAEPGVEGLSTDEVEVGWALVESHRGRGLATEALSAALADVWTRSGVDHVAAYIRPENAASLRVAEKLGLRLRGPGRARSGDPVGVYELRCDD